MKTFVIATIKSWNIENFSRLEKRHPAHRFILITKKEDLSYDYIEKLRPNYLFFPHWSWLIPEKIYANFQCVVFHMTDLPFGRGGSPLQNLLIRGIYQTKISAIKVEKGLDTGDVYLKTPFSIQEGSAQEIFTRISDTIFETMIPQFLKNSLTPTPQKGEVVQFKRRTPKESAIETLKNPSLREVYDFIRMLDAQGYPKAFVKLGTLTLEFSEVEFDKTCLKGTFKVRKDE